MDFLTKIKDLFRKDKVSLGLDIGTATVKLVKLKFTKEGAVELLAFAVKPSLKELSADTDVKQVNVSISGTSAIIRYITFPKMSPQELKQALKFEAQKYIPFPVAELNLGSVILKDDLPDNKMLVLLAAVRKEILSQRVKALDEFGLQARLIDIDSLALINAFNFNYPPQADPKNKSPALLNIGASFSNLNILEDGIPRLSRDIHIAGNNFTQKIADTLGMEFLAAEELKLNPDQESLSKITVLAEGSAASLVSEIRTSFDYYESQGASSVGKIYLSGEGSILSGLKEALASLLGIEVEYWNPLAKINLSPGIDAGKLKGHLAQLPVAVGLALRP